MSVEHAILQIVREHHWPPSVFGPLYLDSIDHNGLFFWYDDVMKVQDERREAWRTKT